VVRYSQGRHFWSWDVRSSPLHINHDRCFHVHNDDPLSVYKRFSAMVVLCRHKLDSSFRTCRSGSGLTVSVARRTTERCDRVNSQPTSLHLRFSSIDHLIMELHLQNLDFLVAFFLAFILPCSGATLSVTEYRFRWEFATHIRTKIHCLFLATYTRQQGHIIQTWYDSCQSRRNSTTKIS